LPNRPVHLLALLAEPDQTPSAAATPPLRFYLYRLPRSLDTYYLPTALDVRGYLVFLLLLIKSNCRSRVSFNRECVAGITNLRLSFRRRAEQCRHFVLLQWTVKLSYSRTSSRDRMIF